MPTCCKLVSVPKMDLLDNKIISKLKNIKTTFPILVNTRLNTDENSTLMCFLCDLINSVRKSMVSLKNAIRTLVASQWSNALPFL